MMDDPRFAPIRRYENVSGVWGWVAAVSALLLIGFIIVASFNKAATLQATILPWPAAPPHRRAPRAPARHRSRSPRRHRRAARSKEFLERTLGVDVPVGD